MSKYSTKGREVKENGVSKWITPGSVAIAKICNVEGGETAKGSKYVKVTFMTKDVEGLTPHKFGGGQIGEDTWWLTANAEPYTVEKLIVMADKLGVRIQLDNEMDKVNGPEDFQGVIERVFKGIAGAWLFGGEEILLTDDDGKENIWVKPSLMFKGFVANLAEQDYLEARCEKLRASGKLIQKLDRVETASTTTEAVKSDYSDDKEW